MSGIWVVLSKTAVITWLIVLVSGAILAIVSGIVEYRDLKKGEAESEKESLEEPEEEKRHSGNGNHGTDGGRDRDGVQRVEALRGGDGDSGIGAGARAVAEGVRRTS